MNITDMRRKAEEGSCVAQSVLGACYLYGEEVDTDYKEAFRYLSAAAEQGASRAVLNLGHMYAKGLGVPQNVPEAIRLYEAVGKAASITDAFAARIELARIFALGRGISIDRVAALKWYSAALDVAPDDDSEDLWETRAYVAPSHS